MSFAVSLVQQTLVFWNLTTYILTGSVACMFKRICEKIPNLVLQLIGVILIVTGFYILACVVFFINCHGRLLGAILVQNIWKNLLGRNSIIGNYANFYTGNKYFTFWQELTWRN